MKKPKKKSLMDKIFYDSDYLIEVLRDECRKHPEKEAEYRYKIVMLTILPLLLCRTRDIFFLFSIALGMLITHIAKC